MNSRAEETIFEATLALPPEKRATYLDQACGKDPQMRQRIEGLIQAHEKAGAFMAQPAVPRPGPTVRVSVPLTEKPGDKIGHYKLLQQVGEGGCGVVYMAEQQEPIKRRVAFKVIKLGMDTKAVIARFEAERQALALMDHPNIAKVLDAGATDTGRPYFVMELVRGIKITDYCDQNNLSTEARLDLFIQVCHAIQHAHQKGIIHRDIKPSNILVTINDGVPVPKVIDFGIAKATGGQQLTDKTLFTAFEQFIGTPAYMSPEQAEMTSLDIDTRSDIYALGVLLYELLTGQTPFDPKTLLSAGLDEMRRIIREQEPDRPSTRLSTLDHAEQTTVAKRRQSEPLKLIHQVRGDLDWIVMKCLEKDRTRRYETANALAMDLQHHLTDEPVTARPPTARYRLSRLIRRHRLEFTVAAAFLTLLAGATLLSSALAVRATRAEREQVRLREQAEAARTRAEANEKRARTEAIRSARVAGFLQDMLQGVDPSVALGRDTTIMREILDRTAERLEQSLRDEPAVEAELRNTIGEVYRHLGEYEKAENMQRRALALRTKLSGTEVRQVAVILNNLALVLRIQGKLEEAERLLRESLGIQRGLRGNEDPEIAVVLDNLGVVVERQGRLAEAESLYREGLTMFRKLLGNENLRAADAAANLAGVLRQQGKLTEAEALAREALATRRQLCEEQHPDLAQSLSTLGNVLRDQGKLAEAETMHREALAMRKKLLGPENAYVAQSVEFLSIVLQKEGKPAEAETLAREGLALRTKLKLNTEYAKSPLAHVLMDEQKYAEAEPFLRDIVEMRRKKWGNGHPDVAAAAIELGDSLRLQGKLPEAEAAYRECLAIREKKMPDAWETFCARSLLGDTLRAQRKYAEAEPLLLSGYEGMERRKEKIPGVQASLKAAVQRLIELDEATGRTNQAARWKEELGRLNTQQPSTNLPPALPMPGSTNTTGHGP